MKLSILLLGSLAIAAPLAAQPTARRTLTVDDLFALKRVSDPQVSPDEARVIGAILPGGEHPA